MCFMKLLLGDQMNDGCVPRSYVFDIMGMQKGTWFELSNNPASVQEGRFIPFANPSLYILL